MLSLMLLLVLPVFSMFPDRENGSGRMRESLAESEASDEKCLTNSTLSDSGPSSSPVVPPPRMIQRKPAYSMLPQRGNAGILHVSDAHPVEPDSQVYPPPLSASGTRRTHPNVANLDQEDATEASCSYAGNCSDLDPQFRKWFFERIHRIASPEEIRQKYFINSTPAFSGTSGQFFFGIHLATGVAVGIKRMSINSQHSLYRNATEIEVLSGLDHPNIIKYYDCYMEGESALWLVMGYAEGGDLFETWMSRGEGLTPVSEIASVAQQVLSALAYIHQKGIIHRDIKLENLLLQNGKILLADFGISIRRKHGGKVRTVVGTLEYMPPEVFLRTGYTEKFDIYSLGILLFKLATFAVVPSAWSVAPTAMVFFTSLSASQLLDFDAGFMQFLLLCLDPNPDKRPSAEELLQHDFILSNTDQ